MEREGGGAHAPARTGRHRGALAARDLQPLDLLLVGQLQLKHLFLVLCLRAAGRSGRRGDVGREAAGAMRAAGARGRAAEGCGAALRARARARAGDHGARVDPVLAVQLGAADLHVSGLAGAVAALGACAVERCVGAAAAARVAEQQRMRERGDGWKSAGGGLWGRAVRRGASSRGGRRGEVFFGRPAAPGLPPTRTRGLQTVRALYSHAPATVRRPPTPLFLLPRRTTPTTAAGG